MAWFLPAFVATSFLFLALTHLSPAGSLLPLGSRQCRILWLEYTSLNTSHARPSFGFSSEVCPESSLSPEDIPSASLSHRLVYLCQSISHSLSLPQVSVVVLIGLLLAVDCKISESKDLVFLVHGHCLWHLELCLMGRRGLISICLVNKSIFFSYGQYQGGIVSLLCWVFSVMPTNPRSSLFCWTLCPGRLNLGLCQLGFLALWLLCGARQQKCCSKTEKEESEVGVFVPPSSLLAEYPWAATFPWLKV